MATKTAAAATLDTLLGERDALVAELEALADPSEIAVLAARRDELERRVDGDEATLGAFSELAEVRSNLRDMQSNAERMRRRLQERIAEARSAIEKQARIVLIEDTEDDFQKARAEIDKASERLLRVEHRRLAIREYAGVPVVEPGGVVAGKALAVAAIALTQDRAADPHEIGSEIGKYKRRAPMVRA